MGEKFKRKKFFINKRLQIRYMVSMLIPMLVLIIFIGLVMYYSQQKFLLATTKGMSQEIKNIIVTNKMYVADENRSNQKSVDEIREKLANYDAGEISFSGDLLKSAYQILFLGLFIVILELGFLTIFISHKVAGPIYRLVMFAKDIMAGNFKTRIYLRQGDELLDVAMDFNKMGEYLTNNFNHIMDINARLLAVKKGDNNEDIIKSLEKEMEDIKRQIQV